MRILSLPEAVGAAGWMRVDSTPSANTGSHMSRVRQVIDNLLSNAGRKHTDRVSVYALFTDPPLGRVGMNDSDIRRAGIDGGFESSWRGLRPSRARSGSYRSRGQCPESTAAFCWSAPWRRS